MTALNYINTIHKDRADGYITLLKKGKGGFHLNYKLKELYSLIDLYEGTEDVYVSQNTFYIQKRLKDNIRQLRALFVDLDVQKDTTYTIDEVLHKLDDIFNANELPRPTLMINSGRGIHLIWRIKDAPKQALGFWQEIEDRLNYKLKHLGADPAVHDCTRVLRLPNTINSKNGSECHIIELNKTNMYTLTELRENYFPRERKKKVAKTTKKTSSNVKNLFNSYTLHTERLKDIKKLCELRNWDMDGYRNYTLLLFAYWTGIYTREEDLFKDTIKEFNSMFLVPQKDWEVKTVIKSAGKAVKVFIEYEQGVRDGLTSKAIKGAKDKKGFWYKNETLIKLFGITAEEQKHMKTIISKDEKNERRKLKDTPRNENGLTSKEQSKADKIAQVKALKEQGLNNTQISKELGISRQYVIKLLGV
jgi:hypothetical protein